MSIVERDYCPFVTDLERFVTLHHAWNAETYRTHTFARSHFSLMTLLVIRLKCDWRVDHPYLPPALQLSCSLSSPTVQQTSITMYARISPLTIVLSSLIRYMPRFEGPQSHVTTQILRSLRPLPWIHPEQARAIERVAHNHAQLCWTTVHGRQWFLGNLSGGDRLYPTLRHSHANQH